MMQNMINQDINRTRCRVVECIVEITLMNYQKIIEFIETKILKTSDLNLIIDYIKLDMIEVRLMAIHLIRKINRVKDYILAKIKI